MGASTGEISEEVIERIARRVVEILDEERNSSSFVDASFVADKLGVERDWVYEHSRELGAIRLGGPHGRIRFDMQIVRERLPEVGAKAGATARRANAGRRRGAGRSQPAKRSPAPLGNGQGKASLARQPRPAAGR